MLEIWSEAKFVKSGNFKLNAINVEWILYFTRFLVIPLCKTVAGEVAGLVSTSNIVMYIKILKNFNIHISCSEINLTNMVILSYLLALVLSWLSSHFYPVKHNELSACTELYVWQLCQIVGTYWLCLRNCHRMRLTPQPRVRRRVGAARSIAFWLPTLIVQKG